MMSFWPTLILIIILIPYLLDLIVELLDSRNKPERLPDEVADVYNEEEYQKSLTYGWENTRLSLISATISLPIMIFAIFGGGFAWLDEKAKLLSPYANEISQGLVFVALFGLISSIISMPFSIYKTFVIEERYGFNRTTLKTFILDQIKALFLAILIGTPLFSLIIWLFGFAADNPYTWAYVWAVISFFQILMMFLSPVIMSLFNTFEPLEDGDLKDTIQNYAKEQNFSMAGLFKMDGSKRSTKSNAFFSGFGRFKKIVLFDTLIEKHSPSELLLVLAHEMGHFKLKHIIKQMLFGLVTMGLIFYFIQQMINNEGLFAVFGMEPSIYASLIFITSIVLSPLMMLIGLIGNYFSRKYEYEADNYAKETTGQPEELINALKKLSRDNLSNLTPHPLKTFLEYSHPTVVQRIRALRGVS